MSLTLSAGGFFRKGDVTLKYNGSICDSIPCITGESARVDLCFDGDEAGYLISLNMYTDEGGAVVLEYIVPEYDYNGNGYLDFGDCDFLTAFISGWDIDLGDCPTDVNGDGATNLYDVTALGSLMLP